MAASGLFQTRKSRTHQYFTSQKDAWRIIVFTGARKPENQLSFGLIVYFLYLFYLFCIFLKVLRGHPQFNNEQLDQLLKEEMSSLSKNFVASLSLLKCTLQSSRFQMLSI